MSAASQRTRSPWLLVALLVVLSAATTACDKKEDGGYSIPTEEATIQSCPDGTEDCTAR
ncbi:MAG: hypothetical protein KBF47_02435 [Gemmatimonadales bacterium]|nr:hypothetical protein [Gemmatimonadales bacterium]